MNGDVDVREIPNPERVVRVQRQGSKQGRACRGRQRPFRLVALGWLRATFLARTIRAVKIVVRDGRIPRPIRWGGALGLAPVPGPFDECVLLLVGGVLWLFYRDQLREAWQHAEKPRLANRVASSS